jgi:hypothetical protein
MEKCYNSYKKNHMIKTGAYLLKQKCCDILSCTDLADDLQDLHYECNNIFKINNTSQINDNGGNNETLCSRLKDKQLIILNRLNKINMTKDKLGGKTRKQKYSNKKRRKLYKTNKMRKHIKV